jgi:hypothetical protein
MITFTNITKTYPDGTKAVDDRPLGLWQDDLPPHGQPPHSADLR